MELVVRGSCVHAVELSDDDFELFRVISEPAGCAMSRGPWAQMEITPMQEAQEDSDTESGPLVLNSSMRLSSNLSQLGEQDLQHDVQEVPLQMLKPVNNNFLHGNDRHRRRIVCKGATAKCLNHANPTHPPTFWCRNSYLMDAFSTSPSSDESACNEQGSTGKKQELTLQSNQCALAVPVSITATPEGGESIAVKCAGELPGSWTERVATHPAALALLPVTICQSDSAPSIFSLFAGPDTVPNVVGCSNNKHWTRQTKVRGVQPDCGSSSETGAKCNMEARWLSQQPHVTQKIVRAVSDLPFGNQHRFHDETRLMGLLSNCARQFTKTSYQGRLSIVTENRVHSCGLLEYVVRFAAGKMSSADGVGFIFSSKLPCTKNIQRIVSVFANREGRICFRAGAEVVRSPLRLQSPQLGDWIALSMDLTKQVAYFSTVCKADGKQSSQVSFAFGDIMKSLTRTNGLVPQSLQGYFACVVKNLGVTVQFLS